MAFNYRNVLILFLLGLLVMAVCIVIADASPNQSYVEVVDYSGSYGEPLNYTPYIYQGDTVFLNTTIDISGVVPPYPQLAYWNGYDMYDSNASYIINLPDNKKGYYKFYVDPAIFETRLGKWYKYNGNYEGRGWNLAFVVSPLSYTNYTMRFPNGTLMNLSEVDPFAPEIHPEIKKPPLPVKHVGDYLVARGDSFNISGNTTMNVWMFGRANQLLNYKSVNGSIDIPAELLSGFEPGSYTFITQRLRENTTDFTVTYDAEKNRIRWFDPTLFEVHNLNLDGLSPQVTMQKFSEIMPHSYDNFTISKFEFQEPYIEIMSIEEKINPNETIDETGTIRYNTNLSFIEVVGYTNVAPGSALKFILD